MTLIERIRALLAQVNPNYKFEYENDFMMNVKADDAHFPVAYFEEYTEGRYNVGYGTKKSVMVELHFYRLVPMHSSATVREQERTRIEEEIQELLTKVQAKTATPEETVRAITVNGAFKRRVESIITDIDRVEHDIDIEPMSEELADKIAKESDFTFAGRMALMPVVE